MQEYRVKLTPPDGYEFVIGEDGCVVFEILTAGDTGMRTDGTHVKWYSGTSEGRYFLLRKIEPIPSGVFWLESSRMFKRADGESLYRFGCTTRLDMQFDYDKWLPRAADFPKWVEPPKPKMIPLDADDIVPGTVIRMRGFHWVYVSPRECSVLAITDESPSSIPYEVLKKNGYLYKTPAMTEFKLCEKEAK